MPNEAPRYRIHTPTLIKGVFFDNQHVPAEIDLPTDVEPRNSFEPLNEAARDAFRKRDAKKLKVLDDEIAAMVAERDELTAAGAGEAELEGFNTILSKLRLARAQMPRQLKTVPTFGGAAAPHSLVFGIVHDKPPTPAGVDTDIEAAKAAGASEEKLQAIRLERVVTAAVAGGASEADVEAIKQAFAERHAGKAAAAIAKATEGGKKATAEKKEKDEKAAAEKKPTEPRLND